MKLNAGIITQNLQKSKTFYTEVLGFGITFENEWFALLHTPDKSTEIGFLLPGLSSQKPVFGAEFSGKGVYLTIEVDEVDKIYEQLKSRGIPIEVDLRNEPWGDRHFTILDPNGIGVDIVTYSGHKKLKTW
jgi:catechol 2,3-dioxygenase-like lactoylglutathione lyase family enzyme